MHDICVFRMSYTQGVEGYLSEFRGRFYPHYPPPSLCIIMNTVPRKGFCFSYDLIMAVHIALSLNRYRHKKTYLSVLLPFSLKLFPLLLLLIVLTDSVLNHVGKEGKAVFASWSLPTATTF